MSDTIDFWRPSATLESLRARARLLDTIRGFFRDRGVLEVDTPQLGRGATVDRHIEPLPVAERGWLHTSPEFAMKRLLAAGSGPIFQLCHVFRDEPCAPLHDAEFMMLEWYRPAWPPRLLMDEVEALLASCGVPGLRPLPSRTWRESFEAAVGVDPFTASATSVAAAAAGHGVPAPDQATPDELLDLCFGSVVAPALGTQGPEWIVDFPASQAALARVRPGDPPVAERFELVWKGVELANGFHELTDAQEQRRRFEADRDWRLARGRSVPPADERLLEALAAGMPEASGIALGVDRLLMLLLGLDRIEAVLPFGGGRA